MSIPTVTGLGVWAVLGIGQGDATLTHSATPFETDLDMRMVGGVAQRLRLRLARPDGLEMELFTGRNDSEYRAPQYLMGLTGRLRF